MSGSPPAPLVVVGHTETGLELARRTFAAHRDVVVPPPAPFVARLGRRRCSFEGVEGLDVDALADLLADDPGYRAWGLAGDARELIAAAATFPDAIGRLYAAYARSRDRGIAVDVTPGNALDVALLAMLFPATRFLHLTEDPRDSVGRRRPEVHAAAWREAVEAAEDAAAWLPASRFARARIEDLTGDPVGHAKSISERLELGLDPGGWGDVIAPRAPQRATARRAQVRRIELIAGDVLEAVGYTRRTDVHPLDAAGRQRLVMDARAEGLARALSTAARWRDAAASFVRRNRGARRLVRRARTWRR